MFNHLQGLVFEKEADSVVVDVGGVGYRLGISTQSYRLLPERGAKVFLFVHQSVRENEIALYGFFQKEERALFLNLLRVSNIGPSIALRMLGQAPLQNLVQAIITGDLLFLQSIKGLGKKTAERIVVELKDRLCSLGAMPVSSKGASACAYPQDAFLGLLALGFSAEQAQERLQAVARMSPLPEKANEWIKQALKHV